MQINQHVYVVFPFDISGFRRQRVSLQTGFYNYLSQKSLFIFHIAFYTTCRRIWIRLFM